MGHRYRVEYRFYAGPCLENEVSIKNFVLHCELAYLSKSAIKDSLEVLVKRHGDRLTGNSYTVFYDVDVITEGINKLEVKRTLSPFEVKHS